MKNGIIFYVQIDVKEGWLVPSFPLLLTKLGIIPRQKSEDRNRFLYIWARSKKNVLLDPINHVIRLSFLAQFYLNGPSRLLNLRRAPGQNTIRKCILYRQSNFSNIFLLIFCSPPSWLRRKNFNIYRSSAIFNIFSSTSPQKCMSYLPCRLNRSHLPETFPFE